MGNRIYQLYLKQKAEKYKEGFKFKRKLEEEYYQANITPFVITNEEFVSINDKIREKDINMKYKLINNITKEEHLCDKVTINNFDYYVSDSIKGESGFNYNYGLNQLDYLTYSYPEKSTEWNFCRKVIATNNPNIDIPQVVDYIEKLSWDMVTQMTKLKGHYERIAASWGFRNGYNKSQETHSFSEEDMIEFNKFSIGLLYKKINEIIYYDYDAKWITTKELLEIWKNKKIKILYFE